MKITRDASPSFTRRYTSSSYPESFKETFSSANLRNLCILTLVQVESSRKGGRVVVAVVEVVVAAVVQGRSLRHPVP